MKRFFIPGIVGLFILILILIGVSRFGQSQSPTNSSPTPTRSEQDTQTSPTPSRSQENPTQSPEKEANITVSEPRDNDTVGRSFIVQGEARVFENVVSYRVKNQKNGNIIVQGNTMANSPDTGQFGDYTITVTIPEDYVLATNDIIVLEVYQASAKDGSDIDKVTIPLIFKEQ